MSFPQIFTRFNLSEFDTTETELNDIVKAAIQLVYLFPPQRLLSYLHWNNRYLDYDIFKILVSFLIYLNNIIT